MTIPERSEFGTLPKLSGAAIASSNHAHGEFEQIGPYKILQKIAEGGMGVVYMAQQEAPIHRKVALKVIKANANSKQIIARFEAERQALAMMEHSNIARIFDAGTTDDDSPYFVMELVNGVSITEYCDTNQLSIRERLELFVSVCRGVQHAHLKGIIHRDLKPSNVLVALHDGVPVPKVIDFGLAKATEHQTRLTDKTFFTEFGQVVGTLQYMSPEQAELNQFDVDTRTDVYSLGVILFELLTGSTPLDHDTLREKAFLKVLDHIRDSDPPRPSMRLSKSGDAKAGISRQRHIAADQLQQLLAGELDWIVIKALAKERNQRYETPSQFADDVLRHLNDETVVARPPTVRYQLRKFVRRNRLVVISIATVATLLLVGITATTSQAIRASRAESDARDQRDLANERADQAQASANRANQILHFVTDSFSSADPTRGDKRDIKASDVLVHAFNTAEREMSDPKSLANVYATLAESFHGLGDETFAIRAAVKAKQQFETLDRPDQAIAMNNLIGDALLARGDGYRAWEIYSDSLAQLHGLLKPSDTFAEQSRKLGLESLNVDALVGLARATVSPSAEIPFLQPETVARKAVQAAEERYGTTHSKTVQAKSTLASALVLNQQPDQAISLLTETLEQFRSNQGPESLEVASLQLDLSRVLAENDQPQRAIDHCQRAIGLLTEFLTADHSRTIRAKCQLVERYASAGRWEEGQDLITNLHASFNPQDPAYRSASRGIARHLLANDQSEAALQICEGSFPDTVWVHIAKTNPQAAAETLGQRLSLESSPQQRLHLLKRTLSMLLWDRQFEAAEELLSDNQSLIESENIPGIKTQLELIELRIMEAKDDFKQVTKQAGTLIEQQDAFKRMDQVDLAWANSLLARAQAELGSTDDSTLTLAIESFEALNQRMSQMPEYLRWTVARAAERVAAIGQLIAQPETVKQWRAKANDAKQQATQFTLSDPWYRTLLDAQPSPNQEIPY